MSRATLILCALFMATVAAADDDAVRIVMLTSQGDIEIDLYVAKAPVTAGNFLQLVDDGHMDGGSFYRAVSYANDNGNPKIEVIQGGRGDALEGEIEAIDHETTEQTGILHTDGVISMARDGVGTATSEFFIVIGDQPGLDYGEVRNPDEQGFAAFGMVVSGMDVVRAIRNLPADGSTDSDYTKGQMLTEPVVISTVRRAE